MGLFKNLPVRSSKESDAKLIKKANAVSTLSFSSKGGVSLSQKIDEINATVLTKFAKYKDKFSLLRTEEEVVDYFDKIAQKGMASIDTETTSLDPITCTIAGVCLYTPGEKPAYIPLNHISYVTGAKVSNQVDVKVVKECLEKCNEKGVKWVFHNAVFDIRVIVNQIGCRLEAYWDTLIAACCLDENESHRLKDLHLKYCPTGETESLNFGTLFDGVTSVVVPVSTFFLYAAGDAIKTWELMEFQKKYLNEDYLPGPYKVYTEIEIPIISVVVDMEERGVCIDKEFAKNLSEKYHKILEEQERKVYAVIEQYRDLIEQYKIRNPKNILSEPIGINSPKQLAVLLYDIIGLKSPDKKSPRGTGEPILLLMDSPLVKPLLEYRGTIKLLSTYIDKLPGSVCEKTGRIHARFNQYGAKTGRFSSDSPNLENIPSHNDEIRKMFVARTGYALISSDFS